MCNQFILIQSRNFQVALHKFMLCLQSPTCFYVSSIDNWSESEGGAPLHHLSFITKFSDRPN